MKKIVTFGEIMMRLSPAGNLRLVQASDLGITFSGAEANVAASLSIFGLDGCFVTALPDNEIGDSCLSFIRKYGVNVSKIKRAKGRLGIYFVEKGAAQRPSKVIYDRADSLISKAKVGDFDWDDIFEGAGWFHFTGITPALGKGVADLTLEACKKAKEKGIKVSCDLNYRNKLWSKEEARKVMTSLMPYVDVLIANEEDAKDVFGIEAENTDIASGKLDLEGYKSVACQLIDRFGFEKVAITLRESLSASHNLWSALLTDGKDYCFSKKYDIFPIVDRVGGGDSFGAGLIYSFVNGYKLQEAVEFAVAASCLKHSIEGDFNLVSVNEVKALVNGAGSGRVQR